MASGYLVRVAFARRTLGDFARAVPNFKALELRFPFLEKPSALLHRPFVGFGIEKFYGGNMPAPA